MRVALLAAAAIAVLAIDLAVLAPDRVEPKSQPRAKPAAAVPGLVWRSGSMSLTLTDRPCPFEEMAAELEVEGVPPARAYVATQGARKASGCWARDMGGDILTRTPGGDEGTIPLDWFQHEPAT
jgi:hypothetical protein